MTEFPKYPRYKNSGVEWLGEVPEHWEAEKGKWLFVRMDRPVRPEDDVVTAFRDGQVTLRTNRRTEGFTNAIKEHGYQGIRKGDLVIHAMDAFAGAIGVSESDGKSTPVYSACVPRKPGTVSTEFYAYLLRYMAHSGFITTLAKGIRERSTDFRYNDFGGLILPLPPKPEQDRIVAFLDRKTAEIDALIAKKQRQIELLDEQKAILINRAVTRGLSGVASAKTGLNPTAKLKPSGIEWLPQIPVKWSSIKLRHLAAMIQTGPFGSQLHSEEYVENGTPVINPSHMREGRITPDFKCAVTDKKVAELARHKLKCGDIVFARRGELGRCGLVTEKEEGWICGTGSLLLRPNPRQMSSEYLVLALSDRHVGEVLTLQSVGSTMDNLNTGMISDLSVPLPPTEEQTAIVEIVHQITNTFRSLQLRMETQIHSLKTLRSTLIAHAVTGRIKV